MNFRLTHRTRWQIFITLVLIALAVLTISIAHAQGPIPTNTPRPVSDNEVNAVSKTLFCPVCQNVPLEVCETQACVRWREQVRTLLSQGYTEAQVRQYFIDNFGTQTVGVTADPIAHALTVIVPLALIVVIGAVVVVRIFWQRRGLATASIVDDLSTHRATLADDYRARLEEELRKRE